MHRLYEKCKRDIDLVTEHGIDPRNVGYVGALVDICKDIQTIWYYEAKAAGDEDYSVDGDEMGERVRKVRHYMERMQNSGTEADRKMCHDEAMKLLDYMEEAKATLKAMPNDSDIKRRVTELMK